MGGLLAVLLPREGQGTVYRARAERCGGAVERDRMGPRPAGRRQQVSALGGWVAALFRRQAGTKWREMVPRQGASMPAERVSA